MPRFTHNILLDAYMASKIIPKISSNNGLLLDVIHTSTIAQDTNDCDVYENCICVWKLQLKSSISLWKRSLFRDYAMFTSSEYDLRNDRFCFIVMGHQITICIWIIVCSVTTKLLITLWIRWQNDIHHIIMIILSWFAYRYYCGILFTLC